MAREQVMAEWELGIPPEPIKPVEEIVEQEPFEKEPVETDNGNIDEDMREDVSEGQDNESAIEDDTTDNVAEDNENIPEEDSENIIESNEGIPEEDTADGTIEDDGKASDEGNTVGEGAAQSS